MPDFHRAGAVHGNEQAFVQPQKAHAMYEARFGFVFVAKTL
jgi:hypothetical protein